MLIHDSKHVHINSIDNMMYGNQFTGVNIGELIRSLLSLTT